METIKESTYSISTKAAHFSTLMKKNSYNVRALQKDILCKNVCMSFHKMFLK